MPCVVADTSPLFYLAWLGHLAALRQLYGKVNVPTEVWNETLAGARLHPKVLPQLTAAKNEGWMVISQPADALSLPELDDLDAGEREAIALAEELHADLLIIDEELARSAAMKLGFEVTGTLGILLSAKRAGWLTALKPEIIRLRNESTFRISAAVERRALDLAGEQ